MTRFTARCWTAATLALGIAPSLTGCFLAGNRSLAPTSYASSSGFVPTDEAAGNTEGYAKIDENAFVVARDSPLSTFSIDVPAPILIAASF